MGFPSLQLIDRATSPRDEGDPKAEQKSLEDSWQDLALIKTTPKPTKKQRREDLSEPLLSPARPVVPGEALVPGQEDHLAVLLLGWPCQSSVLFLARCPESRPH